MLYSCYTLKVLLRNWRKTPLSSLCYRFRVLLFVENFGLFCYFFDVFFDVATFFDVIIYLLNNLVYFAIFWCLFRCNHLFAESFGLFCYLFLHFGLFCYFFDVFFDVIRYLLKVLVYFAIFFDVFIYLLNILI